MPAPPPRASPRSAPPPRGALVAALALSVAGVAVSLALVRLHLRAHAGETSFCAISDVVNCDKVATSRFSVALGLPVAAWGAIGFGLTLALSAWGLRPGRPHPWWPRGLLWLSGAAAVTASIALALVSKLLIGAWCLLCAGAWTISLALLVASALACRPAGAAACLRADLRAIAARPRASAALAAALLAAVSLGALAYPRYWARGNAAGPAGPGPGVIVEYSDYECPFCARAHEEERSVLAARPGLRVVKRHFPLDDACNPLVKRKIHPGACDRARGGICGEAQGRGDEMDAALFRTQGTGIPAEEIARRVGLDLARFRECMAAPATARRLAEDIASGIRDGVRALPTYVVDGKPQAGLLTDVVRGGGRAPGG